MTVRASELTAFAYCERAWHYARTGAPYQHPDQIERGAEWHAQVEQSAYRSVSLIRLGTLLLFIGFAILLLRTVLS